MNEFEQMLKGIPPVDVFRKLMAAEPRVDKRELASRFVDYFERVDWEALQVIWHWHQPGGRPGLSDEGVNEALLELLAKAGYVIVKQL